MAGVSEQPGQRQSNSHIVALLSLKILLLAFFILLMALAIFEDQRRAAVIDSVREAFHGILPAQSNFNAGPGALDVFEGAESVVEALKTLFGDDLPIVERSESPNSLTLQVDFPTSDLFAGDGQELAPEGAETLRIVGALLEDPRFASAGYRVDVLYGLRGNSSGIEGHRAALGRAGALVRELARQGLQPARLSTGLMPSFAERVRFYFPIELDVASSDQAEGQ